MEKVVNAEKQIKNRAVTYVASVVFWAALFLIFHRAGFAGSRPYLVVSFLINGGVFYGMVVLSLQKRAFSLDLMHALFLFFFLFFAPFVQYLKGAWCWGTSFSDERIFITNLLLDGWVAVYATTRKFRFALWRKQARKQTLNGLREKTAALRVHRGFLIVCVSINVLIAVYLFAKNGMALFSRATNEAYQFSDSSFSLLASTAAPAFVAGTTALAIRNVTPRGRILDWAFLAVQFIALLVSCFPTGMPRFQMAVIYVGLLVTLCPFLRRGKAFLGLMIFGLLVVFPFVDVFRYASVEDVDLWQSLARIFVSFEEELLEGHYDAYTMFMLVQEYVVQNGFSYGMQLIGVALFWVPRTLWKTKPVGSGQTAAEFFRWKFTNLSCPLPCEGYVNFGVAGVLIFAILFSLCTKKADDVFWKGKNALVKLLYPFWVPFLFFFLRGDLLSSFAYIFGFSFTVGALYFVNALCLSAREKNLLKEENGGR